MSSTIEDRIGELEERVLALERSRAASTPASPKAEVPSARDFLLDKAPKTDDDKTLTAGFYLEIISGQDSFDFDDIERFYHQAKEAAPANRRDPPYQNVQKGYFREIGKRQVGKTARNRWALTNTGIARVEEGFRKHA
jgi:hypothetical protein